MIAAARERTLRYILSNPGCTPADIHRAVGVGLVQNTYSAVEALYNGGHIRFVNAGRRKHCYHRSIKP